MSIKFLLKFSWPNIEAATAAASKRMEDWVAIIIPYPNIL
jgi:hypothetical protein